MSKILLQLLLQAVLIGLNAVFASAEIAIISMNDARLSSLAAKGNKKAGRLKKITESPAKFLATIQVAITLSGFLGSAFAADNFAEPLVNVLLSWGVKIPAATLKSICVVVITLLLSYFTLVFGELVPKRFAMKKAEGLALGISGLISGISKIFAPIVWFLSISTNAVLRLMGIDPNEHEESVTEEEIRMMIDAGSEKGTIDREEKELLQNVFEFDDFTAGEIATHRTDVVVLWADETFEDWKRKIIECRHTIYPVCRENTDDIIGIINAKDIFAAGHNDIQKLLKSEVKKPYLVPESVKADVLFKNLKARRESFALVIDEHGGMEGIITMTDILECIMGDFDEESLSENNGNPDIVKLTDTDYTVFGEASVEDVAITLNICIPDGEYDTFGGYVFSLLGTVPSDGETPFIEDENLAIKVVKIEDHRITETRVTVKNPKPTDENNDEAQDDDTLEDKKGRKGKE